MAYREDAERFDIIKGQEDAHEMDRVHFCTLSVAAEVPGGVFCDSCMRTVYYAHTCDRCGGGICHICQAKAIAKRVAAVVERIGLGVKGILINE